VRLNVVSLFQDGRLRTSSSGFRQQQRLAEGMSRLPLGPLRLAFLTQIYELPTGRLSGFINRYGVTPLEPEQHVYPIFFATGTPIFEVLRVVVVTPHD
jgi:hypothetical protein